MLALFGVAFAMLAAACTTADDDNTATATAEATEEAEATASPEAPVAAFPRTIVDYGGATVVVEGEPRSIVSYSPGATEVLFALGLGDRVVAVDSESDFPVETAALPQLAYRSPDPEGALAFAPDLVIMAEAQGPQVEPYRDLGMTVIFMASAQSLDQVYEQITLLGSVTAREDEAAALVAEMQRRVAAAVERVVGLTGPRVFYELTSDLYTAAPESFPGALLAILGAQNIAAGSLSQYPQLTTEAVILADPEVVLLTDAEFGESAESVAARPGWSAVSAVVNGRIHPLDPDLVNRPGPRLAAGIEEMARLLYPDAFQ